MLKNISLLATIGLITTACVVNGDNETSSSASGTDSDSDDTAGDSDETAEGSATGADSTGADSTGADSTGADSTGADSTGADSSTSADSTGGGACGWNADGADGPGYYCGGDGEDPDMNVEMDCPPDLVDGDPCGDVTGAGCCDANGDNWYCTVDDTILMEAC